jgi:hypothetical protein
MTDANTLLAFAADLSESDEALMSAVRAALANSPRTPETLGFYPSGDESDHELAVRKTISLLDDKGIIFGIEDKYMDELTGVMEQRGLITPTDLGRDGAAVMNGSAFAAAGKLAKTSARRKQRLTELSGHYVAATRQIEASVVRSGRRLLGVDLPMGDTVHFIALPARVAERWLDVLLVVTYDNHEIGLSPPLWHLAWGELVARAAADAPRPPFPPIPKKRAFAG